MQRTRLTRLTSVRFRRVHSLCFFLFARRPSVYAKMRERRRVLQQGVLLDTMLTYSEGGAVRKTKSAEAEDGGKHEKEGIAVHGPRRVDSVLVK